MALRSAKNSGLRVPGAAIKDAVDYLKRSYKSNLDAKGNPVDKKSGFAYQPGGAPEFTMCAAGMLAMQVCGEYESPFVHGAADWLLEHPPAKHKFFSMVPTITLKACINVEANTPRLPKS